jgi:hypothetical protein
VPMWAAFQLHIAALGCYVASFEPNRNPSAILKLLLALQDQHHHRWTIYSVAVFVWREVGSCDIKAYKICTTFGQLNSGLKQN